MKSIVALLALVGLTSAVIGCSQQSGSDLAPGVTKAGIRSLRIGMKDVDVLATLGAPYEKRRLSSGEVWVYSRHVKRAQEYPMFSIYVEGGTLRNASADKYIWWGRDEDGVFYLGEGQESPWESAEFERVFPR